MYMTQMILIQAHFIMILVEEISEIFMPKYRQKRALKSNICALLGRTTRREMTPKTSLYQDRSENPDQTI